MPYFGILIKRNYDKIQSAWIQYIFVKSMKRFNYVDFKDELMKALQGVNGKFSR